MVPLHPGDVVGPQSRPLPATLFGWQPTEESERLGFFMELYELEMRVLNAAGAEQLAWTSVNLTDSAVEPYTGLYAPAYTVPATVSYGRWTVQWRFRVEAGGTQQTATSYFQVVDPAIPLARSYVQVADMRAEGVPSSFNNARVIYGLELASRLFEEWTGWTFGPSLLDVDLDGRGGPIMQMNMPVIGLSRVSLTFTSFTTADVPISNGDLRVYNRHIRNNLTTPDDRQNPRVEWLRVSTWAYPRRGTLGESDLISNHGGYVESQQNVRFTGVFGYTDWDGTPFGKIPDLVREAVMRIAMRKLTPLWLSSVGGTAMGTAGPIQTEKTFDQSVTYAMGGGSAYSGAFTGDPEIDQIILNYRRPIMIGGA